MKFIDYINNPSGKKNAVMSNREMYKTLYKTKFDKVLMREVGKIDYTLYHDDDRYICYLKIPSEVVEKFYYDVIIEMSANATSLVSSNLENYDCRFWSNDPSFVFTFAHAFREHDLLITDLDPKMSKLAIKKVAKEKNPDNQVGYVKSIYFAYLAMKQFGLFNNAKYVVSKKYSKSALLKEIEHADKKIEARQEEAKKQSIEKQNKIEKENKSRAHVAKNTTSSKSMSKTHFTKKITGAKSTKRTKRI